MVGIGDSTMVGAALECFRTAFPLEMFLHVWPIQKEHIVVQYSLDL